AYQRNPWGRMQSCRVRANARGLEVEPDLFVPRDRIKEAFVVPQLGKPPRVLVRTKGISFPVELEVESEAEGRRLLHALGFDTSQIVAHFQVLSRMMAHRPKMIGIGIAAAVWFGFMVSRVVGHNTFYFFLVPLLPVAALVRTPTKLEIGADGMLMKWL